MRTATELRECAARHRERADCEGDPRVREKLIQIALDYDATAKLVLGSEPAGRVHTGSQPLSREPVKPKSAADRLA
jgi:hypothetical protein